MDPSRTIGSICATGLPRTRGDGPVSSSSVITTTSASPHTRGWTRRQILDVLVRWGFPAHAGMDRAVEARHPPRQRLPRTRGDGPRNMRTQDVLDEASPHTRGWTRGNPDAGQPDRGFPAHAGMDPPASAGAPAPPRLPRTRGDGPRMVGNWQRWWEASPHTRGWTHVERPDPADGPGFPAHAGMDPGFSFSRSPIFRLPRTRGDGPRRTVDARDSPTASPHTRGWTAGARALGGQAAGFPAHAGMDLSSRGGAGGGGGLPRTRGDGPRGRARSRRGALASPHTRGWTLKQEAMQRELEGFPAHAGMDLGAPGISLAWRGLPRTRGDGPSKSGRAGVAERASPHTRGWTLASHASSAESPGFPAHAGMDPPRRRRRAPSPGLPRTRGDGPGHAGHRLRGREASPHTRGWTPCDTRSCRLDTGFPAHAGMDPSRGTV